MPEQSQSNGAERLFIVDSGLSVNIFIAISDIEAGLPETPRIAITGWAQLNREYGIDKVLPLIQSLRADVEAAIDGTVAAMNAAHPATSSYPRPTENALAQPSGFVQRWSAC